MIDPKPITLFELLSLVISLLGFCAIVVSVLLLIRQTRAVTDEAKSVADSLKDNAFEGIKALVVSIDHIFMSQPDLRPYFYGGRDLLVQDELLYHRLAAVAEAVLDIFMSISERRKHFPHIWLLWPQEGLNEYMTSVFCLSPFICRYLDENQKWYPEELLVFMRRGEEQRQTAKPQGPPPVVRRPPAGRRSGAGRSLGVIVVGLYLLDSLLGAKKRG